MKRYDYYLKLDIRKYFDSIPKAELVHRHERVFKDRRLLETFEKIITSFRGSIGVGIPSRSLTSQCFANFYLGWFDRQVKECYRVKGYVRYVDDMVLWSDLAPLPTRTASRIAELSRGAPAIAAQTGSGDQSH